MLASHAVRLCASASSLRPGVLLSQDQINQSGALSRFPWLKPLFQFGVSVDTFRDFSEQAAPVTAKQGRGLVTAHGSFEALCRGRGAARDHASRECHCGGAAKLREQLLVSVCQNDVPKRAVQRFTWRHWLRALKQLLIHGRTSYILTPRLPAVLKGVPNTKFPEVVYCCCRDCTASSRPYGATYQTSPTVKVTQLPDAFGEQSLPTVLLSHTQHVARDQRRQRELLGRSRTVRMEATLFAVVSAVAVSSGFPLRALAGLVRPWKPLGSPKFANSGPLSSRNPDCSGLNVQLR